MPANGDVMPCPFGENPPTDGNLDPDEQELMAAAANPEGWGDHVAALIHKVGADRVYQLVRTGVGLPENCGGCNERRKALNRLEGWVKGVFTSSEHS